jgi:hypothetical protein
MWPGTALASARRPPCLSRLLALEGLIFTLSAQRYRLARIGHLFSPLSRSR